jgi:hypothetical protein
MPNARTAGRLRFVMHLPDLGDFVRDRFYGHSAFTSIRVSNPTRFLRKRSVRETLPWLFALG